MIWLILGILVTVGLFIGLGENEETQMSVRLTVSALGLLLCLVGFFTKIPANHVGIVYSPFGGTKTETLSEGLQTKSPLDKIYKISTEVQTKTVENLTTQTMDAQYLTSILDIKYKVNSTDAYLIFKQYKTLNNMSDNLIIPTTQRVLESITTQYNIIDILGAKRNEVYRELEKSLTEELALYGVEFVSITINDMDAGAALEAAIAAEAVAKKEVETAEQNLLKAETEAKQKSVQAQAEQDAAKIQAETKLIQAEAEKKANELLNQSLSNDILQKQWIEKWNGSLPTYYGGGETGVMIGIK